MVPSPTNSRASTWPRRFALGAAAAAVPLFVFGGAVTTLEAGMAVEGWLNAEGHFLPLFPVEKWLRDPGTFVEHTHRLFGMLVGLFAIGLVVSTWLTDRRRAARALATLSLLAVCAQGTLGGFRVLENSPRLAFLHGVLGQGVFALLAVTAAYLSRRGAPTASTTSGAAGLRRLALFAFAGVYAQIAVGAWYRHGLRPTPEEGVEARLMLHLAGAMVVFGLLAALSGALAREEGQPSLAGAAGRLRWLLGLQLALGFGAWTGRGLPAAELVFSVLHVLVGALLLAQCAAVVMDTRRGSAPVPESQDGRTPGAPEPRGAQGIGGAA